MKRTVLGTLAIILAAGSLVVAQTTTARLYGVVTDATGGVVPGAQVIVKNVGTAVQRSVTTDAAGQYTVPTLPPGEYELTVTMTGFETMGQKGIELAVGQSAEINLKLKVGDVGSRVEVTGEAPIVDTSTSAVAGVVDEKRIQDLPLNGRDFSQLPLVQPGVVSVTNSSTTAKFGFGTRVSMAGSRPDQTGWLLDGSNVKSMSDFGTPASATGLMLGVDAIQEFQVLTTDYSAEFGFNSGGQINMITKSGTNSVHGTAYEFLRNSAVDARNFFAVTNPPLKRNNFGASAGGPIKKDKAFFFANYEGVRESIGKSLVAIVPDSNVHQGLLPCAQAPTVTCNAATGLANVGVAPEILPYLNLWPVPNGPSKGGGLGTLFSSPNEPLTENFFLGRVDYHLNDTQTLFARVTYDEGSDIRPDTIPITSTDIVTGTRYNVLGYDRIISPQLLYSTRVAYNRTRLAATVPTPSINYPLSLYIFDKTYPPQFQLPGATAFGSGASTPNGKVQNLFDISQNFVYTRSLHSFKFGIAWEKVDSNIDGGPRGNGAFGWGSISDFLQDKPMNALQLQVPGSSTQRTFRQITLGAYFQDDWKVRPNLTVNLGVRYEPTTVPEEKYNRVSMLTDPIHATAYDVGVPYYKNPSSENFSPRVGLAWDPKGDGKTAIRAGFGIFWVDMLSPYWNTSATKNQPQVSVLNSPLGTLATVFNDVVAIAPTLISPVLTVNSSPEILQYNIKNPYEIKFNFAIQRQLPGDMSLTVGYLGDRGIHDLRYNDLNDRITTYVNGGAFVAANAPQPNPIGFVGTIGYTDSQMFYNSLQVEMKKRLTHGFQFQTSYTWSKAIDDAGVGIGSDFTGQPGDSGQDPYNSKSDRGLSPLHREHVFVANGLYALPSPFKSGVGSAILGGWRLSGILTLSTGSPFTINDSGRNAPNLHQSTSIQRPDSVAGRSESSIVSGTTAGCTGVTAGQALGTPTLYFDPCAYSIPTPGFFGTVGRSTLIGPGFVDADASLIKSVHLPLTEASRLEFRADFFNLTNRSNFAVPSAFQVYNTNTRTPISGAGTITSTVGNSRQMQFGLKIIF